jgi:hypothetical protein
MTTWTAYELDQSTIGMLYEKMKLKDPDINPIHYLIAVDDTGNQTIFTPPTVCTWEYDESKATMPASKIVLNYSIFSAVYNYQIASGGPDKLFAIWKGGNPPHSWLSVDCSLKDELLRRFPEPTVASAAIKPVSALT